MRKYFERAKDADTAYTIGSWSFWFIDKFLLPGIGAAVVIWAASQADWFWVAYGLFGVLGAGIVAALAISLVLFLSGIGMRAWRGGARKPTSETSTETAHSAEPVSASQTVAEAGLRLLFKPDQDPLELSNQNVWRWFCYKVLGKEAPNGPYKLICAQIIITFDRPINPLYKRVTCSKAGVVLDVIDFNQRTAIITADVDLTDSVVEMKFSDKPI